MATNDLREVAPRLLAQGLLALRNNAIGPRLFNRDYEQIAMERGSTVDIPLPPVIQVQEVEPQAQNPDTATTRPEIVQVPLNHWYEAPFFLTDRDKLQVMDGIIPFQASAAISALADYVDGTCWNALVSGLAASGKVGTPGTTPFATTTDAATQLARVLNEQKCPRAMRRAVVTPAVEASALGLRAFQDVSFAGTDSGIREGDVGRKFGFDWYMDQNLPTVTLGDAATGAITIVKGANTNAGEMQAIEQRTQEPFAQLNTKGSNWILVRSDAGADHAAAEGQTGPAWATPGALLTFTGGSEQYGIQKAYTIGTGGNGEVLIRLGNSLTRELPVGATLTRAATAGGYNFGFHRDCAAFVSRPLMTAASDDLGSIVRVMSDPVSGITMRLEITREHKRERYSFDLLYGVQVIRPELGAILWS